MDTHTVSNNSSSLNFPDDLRSSFYSDSGLPIRVVTAGELPQQWLFRPISIIKPGSRNLVYFDNAFAFNFGRGAGRVLTILRPDAQRSLLWAFKEDVGSNPRGEPGHADGMLDKQKKITDLSMLCEKMAEQKDRQGSIFPPLTSGHVGCHGFELHKAAGRHRSIQIYPEVICNINPRAMHVGYIFDPRREGDFKRIVEIMDSILVMEEANGNGDSQAFQEPVTLCPYDSYRGRLLAPQKLDRSSIQTIQENASALYQYERSMGMKGRLYDLLAQSGCERFLSLLKDIPENVKIFGRFGYSFDVIKLKQAIGQWDASSFHHLLSAVDERLLDQIGLPESLMHQLIYVLVFTTREWCDASDAKKCILHYIQWDRRNSLMTTVFPNQAKICRTLFRHGLFFPVIDLCERFSAYNPLVVCLLVANGTRVMFENWARTDILEGNLSLLINAYIFRDANLLTEEEAVNVRYEVLWDAVCFGVDNSPLGSDQIKQRFQSVVGGLENYFYTQLLETGNPPIFSTMQLAREECRKHLGSELSDYYFKGIDGSELKSFLATRLSSQRYNDEQLHRHFAWLSGIGNIAGPDLPWRNMNFLGKCYQNVRLCAVTKAVGDDKDTGWLTSLLTTPPDFDPSEFKSVGQYRAITQTAGQHYYQYHHPSKAPLIATRGVEYVHRRFHGIDHAVRAQMATEFLVEVLPIYSEPFRELLKTHPQLRELLGIAELYHDAVAEDEPKNMEELRGAELFERDMRALKAYPDDLIAMVAAALRNKNSNEMSPVWPPFTADDRCPDDELLLRRVLRFGDVVEMLRLLPLKEHSVSDSFVVNPVFVPDDPRTFDPQAIELLSVVNNQDFTRFIKAALLTFRDLACLTGGWHHHSDNPVTARYGLQVNNQQRRLLVEQSPDPYTLMREVLDDLVRLAIAQKAGISPCVNGHKEYKHDWSSLPDCWDKTTGVAGAYRKQHSEGELRQVCVPDGMTLGEKICFAAASELPCSDRLALSCVTSCGIENEIARLQRDGIKPATGTPSQYELKQMYEKPDSVGRQILADRSIVVQQAEHDGRAHYRMEISRDEALLQKGFPLSQLSCRLF